MPSSGSSAKEPSANPAAARIRENQRRSRARRKEYVEGMEKRLGELERRGVEATLEMQQAARTVAVENSRLRLLLQREGVSTADVTSFLDTFAHEDQQHAAQVAAQQQQQLQQQQQQQQFVDDRSDDDQKTEVDAPWTSSMPPNHPSSSASSNGGSGSHLHHRDLVDKLSVLAEASVSSESGHRTSSDSSVASPHSSRTVTMPTTPAQHYPPHHHHHHHHDDHVSHNHHHHHSHQGKPPSSPMLMSCNTAAQIIAQMQGTGSTDHYKAKMGCKQECECLVKNTLLFQIMDGGQRAA